jgi:LysR family transcriptional activator of glutamate synthase operon
MDLTKLETFVAAARTSSFHLAADELFLTPSTVSKHISYLEKTYNVVLFQRFSRGVKLTEQGELFLPYAERILGEHRALMAALAAAEVRLCIIPPHAMLPCLALLNFFEEAYPEYRLSISEEHGGHMSRLLAEGRYQLGICGDRYLDENLVDWHIISESRVVALVNKEHPLAGCECISLAELAGEEFVSLPSKTGVLGANSKMCQSVGIKYKVGITTEREENIVFFVAKNMGVALINTEYLNEGFIQRHGAGMAVPLPLTEDFKWHLVLAKAKRAKLPPPAAAFWSFALELGRQGKIPGKTDGRKKSVVNNYKT